MSSYDGRPWEDPDRVGWFAQEGNLEAAPPSYELLADYAEELEDRADEMRRTIETGHAAVDGEAVLISSVMYRDLVAWLIDGRLEATSFPRRQRRTNQPLTADEEHYWVDIGKTCEWCHAPWGVVCVTDSGYFAEIEHLSRRIYPNYEEDSPDG